jgi:hypothetical protein
MEVYLPGFGRFIPLCARFLTIFARFGREGPGNSVRDNCFNQGPDFPALKITNPAGKPVLKNDKSGAKK